MVIDDVDGAFDTSSPAVQFAMVLAGFELSLSTIFLCLSGIELYGTLIEDEFEGRPILKSRSLGRSSSHRGVGTGYGI